MRYFIEVAYKGARYQGFQVQKNALTIQKEVEKALRVYCRQTISLTGSSRTDAGVHALQNYFHADDESGEFAKKPLQDTAYHLNAILPADISIQSIRQVKQEAHCRFDALARAYRYVIYTRKNPFLQDRAYFYPYSVDREKLQAAASVLKEYEDFTSFSKRNTQVKTFLCKLAVSEWLFEEETYAYHVRGNRFLRGMVRALTSTMLKVGRGKLSLNDFRSIIEAKDCTKAWFDVPAHGLFLEEVAFPDTIFSSQ